MVRLSLILLAGCAGTNLSPEAELTLSATNGAEEALVAESKSASTDAVPDGERPDPFRACDAEATYADLFGRYDADADGDLDTRESGAVTDARAERSDRDARMLRDQWEILLRIYDLDASDDLDAPERATLLDDFTVRCDALQARLLEEFDTDADGALSDTEKDAARADLDERMAEHCEGMREGGPPHDGPPEGGLFSGPPDLPPPLVEFDADGDGALSDAETATMRAAMREHIRGGDPMGPPPR